MVTGDRGPHPPLERQKLSSPEFHMKIDLNDDVRVQLHEPQALNSYGREGHF
jgi:hypothetical protein